MGKSRATYKYWTASEDEALREAYPHKATCELIEQFGRSMVAIYGRANKLGLHKTAAFLASPGAHRLDGIIGASSRYKRGHKPHNTGVKGWQAGGRAGETQFKKGQRGSKWLPIGSERIVDEILYRKVTDTGYPPRDWKSVHSLIWIARNGPIPPGYIVIFDDGNKRNFDPGNLKLITRAENMRRNSFHTRYSKEVGDLIMLRAALVRQINRRARDEK